MKQLTSIKGTAIPMNINNIDTDIIIPAQYLTSTSQTGYGQYAFARLKSQADFVLNQNKYNQAPILKTGANFGCGSSREHAVWAIQELGIKAIIAPSFADIFSNNANKNGLLLIQQDTKIVENLFQKAQIEQLEVEIDIQQQVIKTNELVSKFKIDAFFKHCLINGLDELDYLMSQIQDIKSFKQHQINNTLFINN